MGTIIEFPKDAASRCLGSSLQGAPEGASGTILILPVIRIEREGTNGDRGPEQGKTPGRRRRRR